VDGCVCKFSKALKVSVAVEWGVVKLKIEPCAESTGSGAGNALQPIQMFRIHLKNVDAVR
jgi:hypothetical protein